jgi:hypothetical protein
VWDGDRRGFTALGDDRELFIVVPRGRPWFPTQRPAMTPPRRVVLAGRPRTFARTPLGVALTTRPGRVTTVRSTTGGAEVEGTGQGAVEGQGGAGDAAEASPRISEQDNPEQTQSPPAPDDVGVPSDEELSEESAGEGD